MADSKLKSADLIRIRQGLGSGSKATTQTARLARKLAAKTKKRNKVTVSYSKSDLPWHEDHHVAIVKRGGKPIANALIEYDKGVDDLGYVANKNQRLVANRSGVKVNPAKVGVWGIQPSGQTLADAIQKHDSIKNTVLKPREVRTLFQSVRNQFPRADEVIGSRQSGAHMLGTKQKQGFRLPKPQVGPSRLEKAVRSNSSRLRGAMKGVELLPPKLSKALARGPAGVIAAPLEAGFTAYASGGGVTGAATAAAVTTGVGAGITTALKKAGTIAAKHAPGLARVAGKAAIPLAVAGAGYDLFRTAQEGTRAYQAHQAEKRNEQYMNENYGSIEAATATRRRRTGE